MSLVRPSDQATYVEFNVGDTHERVALTPNWLVRATLHEVATEQSLEGSLLVPEEMMHLGLFAAGEINARLTRTEGWNDERNSEEVRELFLSLASGLALFNAWEEHEELSRLLRRAAQPLPVRAVVAAALGTNLSLSFQLDETSSSAVHLPGLGRVPTYRIPATVSCGGSVVLYVELEAAEPLSPLALPLGIVEIRGVHPRDPRRTIVARLVGAQRAEPPPRGARSR